MVKVGEVEFLVKFDGINTQFKKALEDAIKSSGIGTSGAVDQNSIDDLKRGILGINSYLDIISTPTHGDYWSFASQHARGVYKKEMKEEWQPMIQSALQNEKLGHHWGLTEEEMAGPAGNAIREEIADLMGNRILQMFDQAMDKNKFAEIWASKIAPIMGELQSGEGVMKSDLWRLFKRVMEEFTIKQEMHKEYRKEDIKFIEPEKRRYFLKRDIGIESVGTISRESELLKKLKDKLTPEQIEKMVTTTELGEYTEDVEKVVRDILADYRIKSSTVMFSSIAKIFDKVQQELEGTSDEEWERIWTPETGGHTRADSIILLTKDTIEKFLALKKRQRAFKSDEEVEKYRNFFENELKSSEYIILFDEYFLSADPNMIAKHMKKGKLDELVDDLIGFITTYVAAPEKGIGGLPEKYTPTIRTKEETQALLEKGSIKELSNSITKFTQIEKILKDLNYEVPEGFNLIVSRLDLALKRIGEEISKLGGKDVFSSGG